MDSAFPIFSMKMAFKSRNLKIKGTSCQDDVKDKFADSGSDRVQITVTIVEVNEELAVMIVLVRTS
jgi:hypothetical protein